jgi:hypothetical protein
MYALPLSKVVSGWGATSLCASKSCWLLLVYLYSASKQGTQKTIEQIEKLKWALLQNQLQINIKKPGLETRLQVVRKNPITIKSHNWLFILDFVTHFNRSATIKGPLSQISFGNHTTASWIKYVSTNNYINSLFSKKPKLQNKKIHIEEKLYIFDVKYTSYIFFKENQISMYKPFIGQFIKTLKRSCRIIKSNSLDDIQLSLYLIKNTWIINKISAFWNWRQFLKIYFNMGGVIQKMDYILDRLFIITRRKLARKVNSFSAPTFIFKLKKIEF